MNVFDGGGELGELMRRIDWSQTALGPVDRWPQSLKTCVRIILTSRQPMFVWWGEHLINLYNDAYKAIVGGKHPVALGQPAAVVWREIWDQVGPRARLAMTGNEGTYDEALLLVMERHGYQEETYYTFSYSPVPNEQGAVGGILCANTDDTQRIIGERRLALLRDLAARTADAKRIRDVCPAAAAALATDPKDLPFALLYLPDESGDAAVLAGAAGLAGGEAAPARVTLAAPGPWPLAEAMRAHGSPVVVDDLSPLAGGLPVAPWNLAPKRAAVWPLAAAGQAERLGGALVVGLSPVRPFDDGYRSFLSLVAGQISASMANAQAYDDERRRAEALAEIDRAKTAFFANVSHEFRTPLTLILGPQEDALASPEGALSGESLRAVHRNTLRLLKLVNNLLDFSRIEAGRARASYESLDLAALTRDLASTFRSAIERGGLRFDVDAPALREPVYVDRTMWEKVVLNLLSNAFKFTFEGAIGVRLRDAGERVELEVSDTGVGIPAREVERVFERFHRIEGTRARTHEGSGIGLALVRELVALHGGDIRVTSHEGQGTTFTLSVPFGSAHLPAERVTPPSPQPRTSAADAFVEEALRWVPADDEPLPARREPPTTPGSSPEDVAARGAVLIADDNADMRDYLAGLLREHWTIYTAADGVEALRVARERRPDVILTDVMMPNLDGFGLLAAVRADEGLRATPVILLSARAGEESRVEGLRAGADDYIVKPFTARDLVVRVMARMTAARTASAERLRLLRVLEQVPAIVNYLRGRDLVIEFAHPKTHAQVPGRQIVGKPLLEAFPEFREQPYFDRLRHVYETGESFVQTEVPVWLEVGGKRVESFWSSTYLPVRDALGQIDGVMTFDLEVTDQVLARRDLERANAVNTQARDELAHANRAKDEFLAMLGHELRNPLSPIVTSLQLLRMRGGTAREHAIIERQVQHLVRLVDDLLDVSRITRGKIELRKTPLELAQVVLRGLETASPLLERREQRVDMQVPAEGLPIDADPDRLAQVVANLLTNASKYSEPGTTVHLTAERVGDQVRLAVRDEGMGIAPELLGSIFDLFFQPAQSLDRAKGGLGLGLAIVRSLVELHGGHVSARSEGPGKGSEFVVELPAATRLDYVGGVPATALLGAPGAPHGAEVTKRVLIVDDNEDAAQTLAEVLHDLGHEVMTANDGPNALRIAETFSPEICLLDIGLPAMDGYELAQKLQDSRGLPSGARLIAITGYGQDVDKQRARSAGFDDHLIKPVTFEALSRAVGGEAAS